MSFIKEIWRYMRVRKKFWLWPLLVVMMLLGRPDRTHAGLRRSRPSSTRCSDGASRACAFSDFGFYHDSAAALIVDGEIVAAAQEERFSRKKHDARSQPRDRVLPGEGKVTLDQVDLVAFYDKPFLKFERLLETYLAFAPRGSKSFRMAIPIWLREKLFLKGYLQDELKKHGPGFDWEEAPRIQRASPEPRGQRVLSLAFASAWC
jgi:hypothetical protein